MLPSSANTDYIDSTDYKKLENSLTNLKAVLDDLQIKLQESRKLRYAEVDIEAEREAGRIQPDELYIPQHIIDTNIRREQSSYVQYITQSPRAVICVDIDDPSIDLTPLEKDLTKKLRYNGWQLPSYANIDSFQMNGYAIMETLYDENNPGHISREAVQYGDFAFITDTRDLQSVEMTARTYHYTKTKLLELCDKKRVKDQKNLWNREQVDKILDGNTAKSSTSTEDVASLNSSQDKSLYCVQKVMFRVKGITQVAWTCIGTCDGWLRDPRPLYVGRRKMDEVNPAIAMARSLVGAGPSSSEEYESQYPYFLYPYQISENNTISQLKGRVYMDQDAQEATSSLLSSTVTQARRAAGLYFSKEESDPNDDILEQKNIFFRTGCLINSKVRSFSLPAPSPDMFNAINTIMAMNSNETSQVNFAERNLQRDSRKTAAAIKSADSAKQELSTIQVVLFANALGEQYTYEVEIIKSRVQAGLITVNKQVRPLYDHNFLVKPSGDVDVIERQRLIDTMFGAWEIISQTAAAPFYLSDLLEKLFPDNAPKYIQALQQQMQQQQSQEAQMQQQMLQGMMAMAGGIINLAQHREFFSDVGMLHAFPVLQQTAEQLKQLQKQMPPTQ